MSHEQNISQKLRYRSCKRRSSCVCARPCLGADPLALTDRTLVPNRSSGSSLVPCSSSIRALNASSDSWGLKAMRLPAAGATPGRTNRVAVALVEEVPATEDP